MASKGISHPLRKRINYEEAAKKEKSAVNLLLQFCHPSDRLTPTDCPRIADSFTDWLKDAFSLHSVW